MSWEVSTMRCGTSFFNFAVYKSCLKRYWPVWAALLLSLVLSLPLPVLSASDYLDAAEIVRNVGGYGSIVTTFAFSILAAMTVFSWMYQAKSAGFTGALPLRREAVYVSTALAGYTMLALPAVVTALLVILAGAGSSGLGAAAGAAFAWLGKFLLLGLCFFGFACLCAQLTGALWVLPAVYVLLNVAVVGFWLLISSVLHLLLPGFGGDTPQIAIDLSPVVGVFFFDWSAFVFPNWAGLAAYAAFGLVCALLALLLAKKRRLETATDTVALAWLKPVFRWVFSIGFALCFANLIYVILRSEERFHYGLMGLLLVVGAFLGWIIAEMLVRKSYKVASSLKTFPVLAVLLILLVVFCATGGLGYSAYCPAADQVEVATVSIYGNSCTTDDPAEIEAIRGIHMDAAASRIPTDASSGSLQVVYKLKNGRTVVRAFSRETLSEEGKAAYRALMERQLRGSLERALTEPDLVINIGADRWDENGEWMSFVLEDGESRELLRSILADCDAGTLCLFDAWYLGDSTRGDDNSYSLSMQTWRRRSGEEPALPGSWDDPMDGAYYAITVTPRAKNSWEKLEKAGRQQITQQDSDKRVG